MSYHVFGEGNALAALVGRLKRLSARASEYLPTQIAGELSDTLRLLGTERLLAHEDVKTLMGEMFETIEETIDNHVSRRVTTKNGRELGQSKAWVDSAATQLRNNKVSTSSLEPLLDAGKALATIVEKSRAATSERAIVDWMIAVNDVRGLVAVNKHDLGSLEYAINVLGSLTIGDIREDEPAEDTKEQDKDVKDRQKASEGELDELEEAPVRLFFEALADGFDASIGGRL